MKVAYFSPFPPERSGISDFSHELVSELSNNKNISIELFYPGSFQDKKIAKLVPVHRLEEIDNPTLRNSFDHLIYHVGNNIKFHKWIVNTFNKYPGILELHDLSLHYYLAEDTWVVGKYDEYIEVMKYCHGRRGEQEARRFVQQGHSAPWETASDIYTVNKHLVDKATAVIVHSDFAKQMVKGIRPNVKICCIPLHTPDIVSDAHTYYKEARNKLGISEDTLVMGAFGFATIAKRIQQILEAVFRYRSLHKKKKLILYIVGKLEDMKARDMIIDLGLTDCVQVKGFVPLDEFKLYMAACDFCFNLRYPSQGESSASLHRILGMGKPVMVTEIASFQEYPDDIVIKIPYDDREIDAIVDGICNFANNQISKKREYKIHNYALNNLDLSQNAKKYIEFFHLLQSDHIPQDFVEILTDRLMELGLSDEQYVIKFAHKLSDLLDINSTIDLVPEDSVNV